MLSVSSLFRARNENIISNRDDVMNNGCFVRGKKKKKEKKKAVLDFLAVMQQNRAETIIQMKDPPLRWLLAIVTIAADPWLCMQWGTAVSERIRLVASKMDCETFVKLDELNYRDLHLDLPFCLQPTNNFE